jgi:hypothetical protein
VGYAGPSTREFVIEHRPDLEREIGVGSGQTLYDLSVVAGCGNLDALGRELHKRREQIFSAPDTADAVVADRIVDVLSNTPELRCVDLELKQNRVFAAGRRKVFGPPEPGTPPRVR